MFIFIQIFFLLKDISGYSSSLFMNLQVPLCASHMNFITPPSPPNFRRWMLERKLADADVNEEDQINLLKYLERKETEYMHIQRHKMGVDDFELLTIIGRGAFGEVIVLHSLMCYFSSSSLLNTPQVSN